MKRALITNCPNCGAAIERDGNCKYCGTHVRYANEIDINASNFYNTSDVEIMLNIKQGDTMTVLPLHGHIESVNVTRVGYLELPEVEFNFRGYIIPEDKED